MQGEPAMPRGRGMTGTRSAIVAVVLLFAHPLGRLVMLVGATDAGRSREIDSSAANAPWSRQADYG